MRDFSNHYVTTELEDGKIYSYHVPTIWEIVKDYPTETVAVVELIKDINTYINNFTSDDWWRVINADMSYNVIVNDTIGITDGCHRTVKAMMLGYTHLECKRIEFSELTPCKVWNSWEEFGNNPQ